MKLLYLVLDGMADSLKDPVTTLEKAYKPGLDFIAEKGVCGLMYVIGEGVAPESDAAVISLLGYDPHKVYTGRGPLEALGAGLSFREGYEVAFRANFATVEPETLRLIDRRVKRSLSSEEAKELAKAVDNMDLGKYGGYARVKATVGHRAVVIIGSRERKLSPMVENSDPAYYRKGLISVATKSYKPFVKEITPLEDTEEAKVTAELANIFTRKAIEILDKHPINEERRRKGMLPANAILLRDAGGELPKATPLPEKYNAKFALVAEMPVELGIGRAFGAHVREVPPPTGNPEEDYRLRLKVTLELLREYDIVYVHLKGPDEPGHDGNMELKKKRIEEIDKYFVQPFLKELPDNVEVLGKYNQTNSEIAKTHTDDPVPLALYAPNITPDTVSKLTEKECSRGKLGVFKHGWEMLPTILKMIK